MATTQALSLPSKAFTKYPKLPTEIRLMIIEEAIQVVRQESVLEDDSSCGVTKPFLFPLSSVNHEWNKVIEMRLFNFIRITPSALADFDEICSKRHGRLNTIRLSSSDYDVPTDVQPEYFIGNAISQLLDIMKNWDPLDRERHGLIEVQLDVSRVWIHSSVGFNISSGFGALPKVPIVEALYELAEPVCESMLHPWSSLRLYRGLPNVRHVSLNLRFIDDHEASLEQVRKNIASLGIIQPNLTHLELLPDLNWCNSLHNWKLWTPAVDCLASFPRSWSNSLVRLDLMRVDDLPRFLAEAGKVAWPNLKTLVLFGEVNSKDKSDKELQAMNQQTCTALARELSTMLPNTPNISTILIEMHDFSWNYETSFRFQFCLGHPVHGIKTSFGPPCSFASCSYKFVPNHDNGTLVVAGTDFSGYVATQLQVTVRKHQRKDLGVFFHYNKPSTWGRGRCWQWDQEKSNWDTVFENEADEFVYQIGQYLDSTVTTN